MKNALVKFAISISITAICITNVFTQNTAGKVDDLGRIVLNTYVSDQVEGLPSSAKRMLENKLSQIAAKNGMGGSRLVQRFIITPNVTVLTKDLTTTAPPMTALTLEFTLYIGDGIEGTKFASTSIELKGVGKNETKAYIAAIKRINPANPTIQNFVSQGKNKIIEYYNSRCDFIIKDAKSKAERKEFDDAIAMLLSVPEVCKECFNKCHDETINIYKMKLENECLENIQKSKVAIANNNWDEAANSLSGILPDVSCYNNAQIMLKQVEDHRCSEALGKAKGAWASLDANEAGYWLGHVSADSKCYESALSLGNEIKNKLKRDEGIEWDFKMKQQQDAVDIRQANISAARDVGVAYGNNQPKVEYRVKGWW